MFSKRSISSQENRESVCLTKKQRRSIKTLIESFVEKETPAKLKLSRESRQFDSHKKRKPSHYMSQSKGREHSLQGKLSDCCVSRRRKSVSINSDHQQQLINSLSAENKQLSEDIKLQKMMMVNAAETVKVVTSFYAQTFQEIFANGIDVSGL